MAASRAPALLAPLISPRSADSTRTAERRGVIIYLFVGAGGIGASLAARLALHSEVAIVDGWRAHVEAINEDGLRLTLPNAECVVRLPAWTFEDAGRGGLPAGLRAVLLSVKSYDTSSTLDWLVPLVPPGAPVVSLQNGLNEDVIAAAAGDERTVGAVVMFDGVLVGPGHARTRRPQAPLTLGQWGARAPAGLSGIAAELGRAAPVVVVDDIRSALWEKLVINCMLNAPAAASGLGLRDLARSEAGRTACAEVAREAVEVAWRAGAKLSATFVYGFGTATLTDSPAGVAALAETIGAEFRDSELRPSMLTDVERGRRTEIAALNGVIVEEGRRHGVATPWNAHFLHVVCDIEAGSTQPDERWLRP